MDLECSGEIWFWKGPAPWHFVTFPVSKDGGYLVPVKAAVRRAETLELGDLVDVRLTTPV